MKNIYYENIKRNFKRASHRDWTFVNKIYCHHSFENITPNDLTWCADFGFILNDYYVSVAWEHPRMQYSDQINNAANQQVQHLYDEDGADNIFNDAKPNYIKVGKSRKKISSYMHSPTNKIMLLDNKINLTHLSGTHAANTINNSEYRTKIITSIDY